MFQKLRFRVKSQNWIITLIYDLIFSCFAWIHTYNNQIQHVPEDLETLSNDAIALENGDFTKCHDKQSYQKNLICAPNKYRTPKGNCNNVHHSEWGSQGDVFIRLFKPSYSDETQKPRRSIEGVELPEPKAIINSLRDHVTSFEIKKHLSLIFPLWGQLIYNDISKIYSLKSKIDCCRETDLNNTYCYPIDENGCKSYKRSAVARSNYDCSFGT